MLGREGAANREEPIASETAIPVVKRRLSFMVVRDPFNQNRRWFGNPELQVTIERAGCLRTAPALLRSSQDLSNKITIQSPIQDAADSMISSQDQLGHGGVVSTLKVDFVRDAGGYLGLCLPSCTAITASNPTTASPNPNQTLTRAAHNAASIIVKTTPASAALPGLDFATGRLTMASIISGMNPMPHEGHFMPRAR